MHAPTASPHFADPVPAPARPEERAARERVEAWRAGERRSPADLAGLELSGIDLSHEDLAGADLSECNLSRANLAHADLTRAVLRGTTLFEANLEGAELTGADLSGANARNADFTRAGLGVVDAHSADLCGANLTGATLTGGDLRDAVLRGAKLERARVREADLRGADLSWAHAHGIELDQTRVHGACFDGTDLREASLADIRGFARASWIGTDIREVDFRGASRCRNFILDENYIAEFRRQSRWSEVVYRLWHVSSDCGRSFVRWSCWTVLLTALFSVLYTFVGIDFGDYPTPISPLYFSVVTMTTLGFGDAVPTTTTAQLVVMAEVTTGYLMLGGLLSILSNKLASRAG